MIQFEDIKFIIYTNASSLQLADICADKLIEYGPNSLNLDILTNGISSDYNSRYRNKLFIYKDVPTNGSQFTQVISTHLATLENKYVVLLCDDYITTHSFYKADFEGIADFAEKNNIDSINLQKRDKSRTLLHEDFQTDEYRGVFHRVSNQEVCRYSVQPTLWKKDTLLTIASEHIGYDVHKFESDTEIKQKYDYTTLGINWHNLGNYSFSPPGELHYIFSYIETVRHGVFRLVENGFSVQNETYMTSFIKALIEEYNMKNNPVYDKLLSKYGRM